MNLVKIQQELLVEMSGLRVPHYLPMGDNNTLLINSVGSICYIIPNIALHLNPRHLHALDRLPFAPYETGSWTELTPTDKTVGDGKRVRQIFKRGEQEVRLDKNLLKHFAKGVKYYQEKDLQAVAVLEKGVVVAYVMPCRIPKENN